MSSRCQKRKGLFCVRLRELGKLFPCFSLSFRQKVGKGKYWEAFLSQFGVRQPVFLKQLGEPGFVRHDFPQRGWSTSFSFGSAGSFVCVSHQFNFGPERVESLVDHLKKRLLLIGVL